MKTDVTGIPLSYFSQSVRFFPSIRVESSDCFIQIEFINYDFVSEVLKNQIYQWFGVDIPKFHRKLLILLSTENEGWVNIFIDFVVDVVGYRFIYSSVYFIH